MPLADTDGPTASARRKDGSIASVIVVNRRDWGERQRFTVARELGHMILSVAPNIDNEKAAHRIAGAFLMPAESLRAVIGVHRQSIGWNELFDLKRVFGVSVRVLTCRCEDLGIFGNVLFRQLFNELSRRVWRKPPYGEPRELDGEKPRRFERLCYRALAEGAVSETRAAELLGHPVREVFRHMDEPPGIKTASAGA